MPLVTPTISGSVPEAFLIRLTSTVATKGASRNDALIAAVASIRYRCHNGVASLIPVAKVLEVLEGGEV